MDGRTERKIKREQHIQTILNELPSYVEEYYHYLSANKESVSCLTYIQRIGNFLRFINPNVFEVELTSVNDIMVSKYLKTKETKIKNGKVERASFSLWKGHYAALRSFFGYIKYKGYIEKNPMEYIENIKHHDKVEHVFLSREDCLKTLEAVNTGVGNKNAKARQVNWRERDVAIIKMFLKTGMRESALCELNMENINWDDNSLTVIDKENKENVYVFDDDFKGMLKEWVAKRSEILKGKDIPAFFVSRNKNRMSPVTVYNLVKKYSEGALGYAVTPHRLRAAYCNIIIEETGDIYLAKEAMKHSNIQTTMIYLQKRERESAKKAFDAISAVGI